MKSKSAEPVGCLGQVAMAAFFGAGIGATKRLLREHGHLTSSNEWAVYVVFLALWIGTVHIQSQVALRRLKVNARVLMPEDFEDEAREKGSRDKVEVWTVPRAAGKSWQQLLGSEGFYSVWMNCFVLLSGVLFFALFVLVSPYRFWIVIITAFVMWLIYLAYFHPEVVADSTGLRKRRMLGWSVLSWEQITRLELVQKEEFEDAAIDKQLLAVLRSADGREILQLDLSAKQHWQGNSLLYFISRKLAEKQIAS